MQPADDSQAEDETKTETMKSKRTKIVNGQEFTRIRYTNRGAHAPTETWYPTENLEWLRERCCFELA